MIKLPYHVFTVPVCTADDKTTGIQHKPIVAGEDVNSQKLMQGAQAMTGAACRHLAV